MIDSHCHFDFDDFAGERDAILTRCEGLGVRKILIPGTEANRWSALIELCEQYPQLHFALGLHPFFLRDHQPTQIQRLERMLHFHKDSVIAVGEIGLDFAIDVDKELQLDVFEAQLQLAKQFELPVMVHHRQSHNEIIRVLKQTGLAKGGVIHAFSGSLEEAKTYLEMGFLLGVGGTITYERAKKTRETLAKVPLDALLLETDAPDMPIQGRQGQRNSPEYLPKVLACLAELHNRPADEVAQQTSANARALFDLS